MPRLCRNLSEFLLKRTFEKYSCSASIIKPQQQQDAAVHMITGGQGRQTASALQHHFPPALRCSRHHALGCPSCTAGCRHGIESAEIVPAVESDDGISGDAGSIVFVKTVIFQVKQNT